MRADEWLSTSPDELERRRAERAADQAERKRERQLQREAMRAAREIRRGGGKAGRRPAGTGAGAGQTAADVERGASATGRLLGAGSTGKRRAGDAARRARGAYRSPAFRRTGVPAELGSWTDLAYQAAGFTILLALFWTVVANRRGPEAFAGLVGGVTAAIARVTDLSDPLAPGGAYGAAALAGPSPTAAGDGSTHHGGGARGAGHRLRHAARGGR